MERKNRYALRKTSNGLVSCIVGTLLSTNLVSASVLPVVAQTVEEETTVSSEMLPEETVVEKVLSLKKLQQMFLKKPRTKQYQKLQLKNQLLK